MNAHKSAALRGLGIAPSRSCRQRGPRGGMRQYALGILIMAMITAAASSGRTATAADDTTSSKKELQRIKREMREKKKELKRADRKERSILTALDQIDREIQAGKAELAEQQKRLHDAEATLRDVEKSNTEISSNLAGLKRAYAQRVRALYKTSRNGNSAVLLTSVSLGDALKRIKYLGIITERDRSVMGEYSGALDRLGREQTAIAEQKESILERKQAIEQKKVELEAQKGKKASLLAGVREKKGLYEQSLRELEESSQSLWGMIRKTEQERRAAQAKAPAPVSPKAPRTANADKHRLPWPADGQVLTRFGMQRHPQFGTMVFRRGVEISVREGETVRSVGDGLVAYADWYKGYGKLMIIEHGQGFYTLYGNLSRLDLNKGDRVVKGQAIGLAGDTGSLKGAKLYFEIRQNGEAQDPLTWLAKR